MHSLKNTFVAVVLLGVSYFVYQGITNPAVPLEEEVAGVGLDLEIPETDLSNTLADQGSTTRGGLSNFPIQTPRSNDRELTPPPLKSAPSTDGAFAARPSHFGQNAGSGNRSGSGLSDFQPRTQGSSSKDFVSGGSLNRNTNPPLNRQPNSNQFERSSQFNPETPLSPVAPARDASTNQFAPAKAQNPAVNQFTTQPSSPGEFATSASIDMAWPKVQQFVQEGNFRRALGTLSRFYHSANLSDADRTKMLEWLDTLAGKVIYSTEHNLYPSAYVIRTDDTMQSIASQWNVPAQLIYNVNRSKITNPLTLTPGNELKVIKGPFNANLQLSNQTLTLFLDNMYAGRFQTQTATNIRPGDYEVAAKVANGGGHGSFEVELVNATTGAKCSLHAVEGGAGSVGLNRNDAEDLFGILSIGSTVSIR